MTEITPAPGPAPKPAPAGKRQGLLRSSFTVGLLTMLSRVLGLARDISFAICIGAGGQADPFFIAFKIPNFLRRLFAEGAFAQAFVPVLSEYREHRGYDQVRHLVDRVSGVLGSTLIALTVLAVVAAPAVTALFAPGYLADPIKFGLTTDLVRITFPYLFLISMTGFAGAVLNSYGHFGPPAFAPVLLNVCLIAAAFASQRWFAEPVYALAWGVVIAGMAQWLFQMPFLVRLRLLPRPKWDPRDEGVRRVLTLIVPALFGVSVSQINLLLDTVLASFLPSGSVSWLYYSDRLSELPLGIFAIAIATVILPSLARNRAMGSHDTFAATLNWALRLILLIGLPASLALIVLGHPILMTLFQYRQTTPFDILMASYSLGAIAVGLTAFMLIKVLAPGFYAREDLKTPVRIGIIAMVSNMVLNLLFVYPLHTYWQIGHVGLALATSLSAWLNAGLLYLGLRRADVLALEPGWGRYLGKLGLAVVTMGVALYWANPAAALWQQWPWWQRGGVLALLCLSGGSVYLVVLALTGVRPSQLRSPA